MGLGCMKIIGTFIYMYIHMYIMAKTIMISNDAYEKLKDIKEREEKSFSEVVVELVEDKKMKRGKGLRECLGILKGDKEYDEVMKWTKKGWDRWSKKYA